MIIILAWLSKGGLHFRDFLYLRKTKVSIMLLSGLIGFLLSFIGVLHHFYFQPSIEILEEDKLSLSLSVLQFIFVIAVLGPPVEELFFRGILYNFYKKKGILPALILSSLLFSLIHFSLYRVIIIFILGAFLALLYEITQCFWIPVLVHSSANEVHTILFLDPIVRILQEFLYLLHGGNVWLFRIKLLVISIVLCILAIIVMFLIMRISGNNIFQGKEFKNIRVIKRDDDDPLIDIPLILVFIISVSMIVARIVFFKSV
jgi:membrane protease YdiL (CAAX protease family)